MIKLFLGVIFLQKNDENFHPQNPLIGKWYRQDYNNDSLCTFLRKAQSGNDNIYTLIQKESKYSFTGMYGYCASPPTYYSINGTWKEDKIN